MAETPLNTPDSTGAIQGIVKDHSGDPLPGATITVDGPHDFHQITFTDGEGRFRVRLIPPGDYEVKTEMEGFSTEVHKGILVKTGEVITLYITLSVAA